MNLITFITMYVEYRENISSTIPRNTETNAFKFSEYIKEMFSHYLEQITDDEQMTIVKIIASL